MKFFPYFCLLFFLSKNLFSEEIKVIELHEIDQGFLSATEEEKLEEIILDNTNSDVETEEKSNESLLEIEENNNLETITALPDYWENAEKNEIIFLFDNLELVESNSLNEALTESLVLNSLNPKGFTQEEFNHLRISNLIKLGQRKAAYEMINFNSADQHKDFYNSFKLNYFFSTYEINQACEFGRSINRKKTKINENFLLKVDIFCSLIQNKIEEADFLNSLLIDLNDKDEYFQKILVNLKNQNNDFVDINNTNLDKDSMPLYSAMIRLGDMPLSQNFLDYDTVNFSEPIILSASSDISLRLNAAHKAYKSKMFNGESLSALYQTVDFNYDELNNPDNMINKISSNKEIGMAYHFQRANIQILPITRIQALVDFWQFAEQNNLDILAYDVSRKLIDSLDPSPELSDFGTKIAKAHIYNDNFSLAEKWILFSNKYKSEKDNFEEEMQSVKLLYNLMSSVDDNEFNNILLANLYNFKSDLYKEMNKKTLKQEILLTILSVISENNSNKVITNRKLVDNRPMPSRYLLNMIRNSLNSQNYGELILSINISMIGKSWSKIHPEHLRIILQSLNGTLTEGIFREVILEILEETKII